jgi:hypothetical protein
VESQPSFGYTSSFSPLEADGQAFFSGVFGAGGGVAGFAGCFFSSPQPTVLAIMNPINRSIAINFFTGVILS